ncbi:MAG: GNAT family N-acetyltransferase [Cyanobacteriota bacterium]|nr:GNAT family N-acetyltransferase [Cyanobacteriota bacterium]
MNLLTPRLRLRPFQVADINATYLGWLNDPEVTRFSNQRFHQHTAESCAAYLESFAGSSNSFLLITQLQDQRPIGTATVYRNNWHCTADIGLMVGEKRCWGQGYGREAWQVLLEALLSETGIRKVTGGTARLNQAMVRIMEQSGMDLEAVRVHQELIDGQPVDLLYYARFA